MLAGGRHIACDPATQAFMREIPQCWMTGQAAGAAAAIAAGTGTAPRAIDVSELQRELRAQGVHLQTGRFSDGRAELPFLETGLSDKTGVKEVGGRLRRGDRGRGHRGPHRRAVLRPARALDARPGGRAPGGLLLSIEQIEGVPGFPDGVPGYELCPIAQEQAEAAGAELSPDELESLEADDGGWRVRATATSRPRR